MVASMPSFLLLRPSATSVNYGQKAELIKLISATQVRRRATVTCSGSWGVVNGEFFVTMRQVGNLTSDGQYMENSLTDQAEFWLDLTMDHLHLVLDRRPVYRNFAYT